MQADEAKAKQGDAGPGSAGSEPAKKAADVAGADSLVWAYLHYQEQAAHHTHCSMMHCICTRCLVLRMLLCLCTTVPGLPCMQLQLATAAGTVISLVSTLCISVIECYCDMPRTSVTRVDSCFEPVQAAAKERLQQLEAENKQLRQAASKRSEALAQARHFIDSNLQRSSTMLQGTSESQGNGAQARSAQSNEAGDRANK